MTDLTHTIGAMDVDIEFWSFKATIRRAFAGGMLMTLVGAIGAGPLLNLPVVDFSNRFLNVFGNLRWWGAVAMVNALPWALIATILTEVGFAVLGPRRLIALTVGSVCGAAAGYWTADPIAGNRILQIAVCFLTGAICGLVYWWWVTRFNLRLSASRRTADRAS